MKLTVKSFAIAFWITLMIIANDFTVLRVIKEGYFLGSDKLGSTILVELSSLISLGTSLKIKYQLAGNNCDIPLR